ncbi:MAG TPA: 16S rRNA (guanine(527)-N(7))-methyltransferase RsmG [Niabella sp.]|nr:16S rRNA (guanine(527)-N(7))-methyltransferase RsmG [Chitinophagaceae bacterium]HRN48811.1 16S rRNA (guanine(527)-N(7))-methyltransferase RsmG [Niabella sp.]HRO84525.1 16S rRNA (guanine(527)-N(7))-methyltransferase RsmG [Niabella sp.]
MDIISKYFSDFTKKQTSQLSALEGLYKDWNEKINVISRKDIDSLYEKHVLHSLSIAAVFPFQDGTQIVDLGCGGGFPGIPLAIFFPEVHFHLVDSIAKKLKVVEAVSQAVELKNITVQHSRIEDIRDKKFDFVISRAVAPLKDLWKWSKPLIRKNTQNKEEPAPGLICLKGGDLAQEIHESHTRPFITPIKEIFEESFFEEKYILYLPK